MAKRINLWLEEKKCINESQAGYRQKRGTRDHVFVLNALISNRLKQPGVNYTYVLWIIKTPSIGQTGKNYSKRLIVLE